MFNFADEIYCRLFHPLANPLLVVAVREREREREPKKREEKENDGKKETSPRYRIIYEDGTYLS